MEKNKSNNLAVCTICEILTVFGMVASIISLVNGSNGIWMVKDVINLVLSVLVVYYAFCGYRKPNGNLLKYIILIYAASILASVYALSKLGLTWLAVIDAVIIGLCCYIAGRLHRVRQNVILMGIVTVLILVSIIVTFVIGNPTIGIFTLLIIWIDLCAAYFLRYRGHKLAGLMDRAEK